MKEELKIKGEEESKENKLKENENNENKNENNTNENNNDKNNNNKSNNNNNENDENNYQIILNEEEEEEDEEEELKDIIDENSLNFSGKNYKITKVDNDLPLLENISNTTEQKRLINKQIRKNSKAPKKLTKYFSLQEFPKSKYFTDDELKKIIKLVYKFHKNEEEQLEIHKFFLKTKIKEKLKSDLLNANITPEKLTSLCSKFVTSQIFHNKDIIYTLEEKSELIYIILRGNIGLYKMESSFDYMNYEEYLTYLHKEKKNYDSTKFNIEEDNGEIGKTFIDDFVLKNTIEENKEIFQIRKFTDIEEIKDILFTIKIYKDCIDKDGQNLMEIYNVYEYPYSFLGFQDVIDSKINMNEFIKKLSNLFTEKENFYMGRLNTIVHKIKKLTYVRVEYLGENEYFGNFEMIDYKPLRNETARCESNKVLLFAINKKAYSNILYKEQKHQRQEQLDYFYKSYFFRCLNKKFFEKRVYSKFKIMNKYLGDELFHEEERFKNFYIVKEGTLEISISNVSLIDLKNLITKLYDLIKNDVQMNIKVRERMIHPYNTIQNSLNLKRKFLIYTSEKGLFGDYELFFDLPSIFTANIISKEIKLFLFSYEKYYKAKKENASIYEGLQKSAIKKIQYIINRLMSVYDSYFDKIEKEFTIKQYEQVEDLKEKEKILKNPYHNTPPSPEKYKNIKNTSNYIIYENDLITDVRKYDPKEILTGRFIKKKKVINNDTTTNNFNYEIQDTIPNFDKDKIFNNLFKSVQIKKPRKIFLPPIATTENDTIDMKVINKEESIQKKINEYLYNFSHNRRKKKVRRNYFDFQKKIEKNEHSRNLSFSNLYKEYRETSPRKREPLYININNSRIKLPDKIEKNVPLINKMKIEYEKSQNKNENEEKKKIDNHDNKFNPIIRDYFYKGTFHDTLDKVPGAYFVAINQFIKQVKDEKERINNEKKKQKEKELKEKKEKEMEKDNEIKKDFN